VSESIKFKIELKKNFFNKKIFKINIIIKKNPIYGVYKLK